MKTVWNKLKKALQLSKNSEIDLQSRRRILKGAAGLALLAVMPINEGYRLLTEVEKVNFINKVKSGQVIENMTFYVDRTIVLKNLKNVLITNCEFISMPNFIGNSMIYMEDSTSIIIKNCTLNCSNINPDSSIGIQVCNPKITFTKTKEGMYYKYDGPLSLDLSQLSRYNKLI